jgi:hypothetical protein
MQPQIGELDGTILIRRSAEGDRAALQRLAALDNRKDALHMVTLTVGPR